MEWNQNFSALRPSAAKIFAVAWQKKVTEVLQERKVHEPSEVKAILFEAFKMATTESSSLPVRDQVYRMITLHCAIMLLANYHPYGEHIDKTLQPKGWSDSIWSRYLKTLHRHGLEMRIQS